MPRRRSKSLDLNDSAKLRLLRRMDLAAYCRVHKVTGGVSIWTKASRAEGAKWRRSILVVAIPPRSPRHLVEKWCEALGAAPPWIDRDDRKAWRAAWRRRNGLSDEKQRMGRAQFVRMNMEEVAGQPIFDDAEDLEDYYGTRPSSDDSAEDQANAKE